MDQEKITEAIKNVGEAISMDPPVYLRTTIFGRHDERPLHCCITANKAGFIQLGYRFLRLAEGSERPEEKINALLEPDSEWHFWGIDNFEGQVEEASEASSVSKSWIDWLLERASSLAIAVFLMLVIYGIIEWAFS